MSSGSREEAGRSGREDSDGGGRPDGEATRDFRGLADATGLGLWAADPNGRIRYANEALARMLGWSKGETLVGRDVAAFLFEEELGHWKARAALHVLPPAELVEQRFRRKDGTEAWLLVSIAHRAAQGRSDGSIGFCVDVTQAHCARVRGDQAAATLAQLGNAIDEFFWLENPGTREIIHMSPHPERLWGCSAAELRARPDAWLDLVHLDDRQRVSRAWQEGGPNESALDFRIVRRDGAVRSIRGRTFPVFDPGGALIRLARTWEDVTERELVAERLRLQAAALECAGNAIVVTDHLGRVEWTNPAFTTLTGYRPEEVAGRTTRLLKSGVQDDAFYRRLWETISAGRVWHGTLVNRRADGTLYDEEMTISPVADALGQLRHFVAVKQDVTEARRAAEMLRETQELLSQAKDAIVLETVDGRVRTWTRGAEGLFGWTTAEALGQPLSDLLGLCPPERLAAIRAEVARSGTFEGDLRVRSRSGATLEVASRWSRVHDLSGQPRGLLLVGHDVTAERRLKALAERAERLDVLGQVASTVAHDLNNVLTAIFAGLPVLQARQADRESQEVLDTIQRAAELAQGLVRQILDFARGSSGRRRPIRGAELLLQAAKLARPTMPREVQFRAAFAPDLWTVEADPTQIQQVLMNLCVNAREAMPKGGALLLAAANVAADEALVAATPGLRLGRYLEIRVVDEGTGMTPEVVQRLFEPFVTTKERGTGLGLATVYRVIAAHRGAVAVSSEPGRGSEFRVYLPVAGASGEHRAEEAAP